MAQRVKPFTKIERGRLLSMSRRWSDDLQRLRIILQIDDASDEMKEYFSDDHEVLRNLGTVISHMQFVLVMRRITPHTKDNRDD